MIGKTPKEHQMSIFEVALESFIDMNHEPVLLSKQIDWEAVESKFTEYYCADNGRLSVPIRKMVGMMLLKNIYNLNDGASLPIGGRNRTCNTSRGRRCSRSLRLLNRSSAT